MKYFKIDFRQIKTICGLLGRKATYTEDNSILSGVNSNIYKGYSKMYLKLENFFTDTYVEITTGRKLRMRMNDDGELYFVSSDKEFITFSYSSADPFSVEDNKEIIRFFQKLKDIDLYEEYIQSIETIFMNAEEIKKNVVNGSGRVEDSVKVDEYVKCVRYDANRSRELRDKNRKG